ncbi:hypothetical protein [Dactylosporangium darangshiense]|uniref:hypothetical protein n=1 Tax=Dactylosporangium darangshiense TaxID=579108 RepID=UPI00362843C3
MPDTLLLQRLDIGGVIDRLAADVRAGRLPAGMPYRHVNGFTKIVAAEYPDGSRLTLHYWPAGPLGGEHVSRPHDHRFPFRSVLLGGRQHFVELEEGEGRAANWRRFSYRPYAGGRIAHVAYSGTVALDPMRVVERAPCKGSTSQRPRSCTRPSPTGGRRAPHWCCAGRGNGSGHGCTTGPTSHRRGAGCSSGAASTAPRWCASSRT